MKNSAFARSRVVLALASIGLIGGCSVLPEPITTAEQQQILKADRQVVVAQVEPVGPALSLHEAVARGLKFNMDHRQRMLEQAVALGTADLSNFDMLPKLLANAGYTSRNNDFRTRQEDLSGAETSPGGTISSERDYSTRGLSLQWSALDLGISYYTAKQNADRILLSAERRRRTMHVLIQDIQSAYVRAAAAESLRNEIARISQEAKKTLDNSRKVQAEGLRPLLDTLRFQKSVLDNIRLLETIDGELSSAQVELNKLINLPPNARYQFDALSALSTPPTFSESELSELEARALMSNADLKQGIYEARIAAQETRKALLRYFPNLSFNYGAQHSDNRFYVNQSWTEGAAQLSFNLFGLLSAPAANRFADAQKDLAEQRRMTVQMAVLSQVHLSMLQLDNAQRLYQLSANIDDVDAQLVKIIVDRQQKGAASEAERVAAETSAVVSRLRRYQALAALYGASGRLQATVGFEPEFSSVSEIPLKDFTLKVRDAFNAWNSGKPLKSSWVLPEGAPSGSPVRNES